MKLQDVEENDGVGDEIEIPEGFPGSKTKGKVESIHIPSGTINTKRRGRPPGSRNKSNGESATNNAKMPDAAALFTEGCVIGYATLAALLAVRVLKDNKYRMTQQEAKSAAVATVQVLFKYKEIREFAATINTKGDIAVLLKGFYPYLSRVFLKEFIENVVFGLSFPGSRNRTKSGNPGNPGSFTSETAGTGPANRNGFVRESERNSTESPLPAFNGNSDWRDV